MKNSQEPLQRRAAMMTGLVLVIFTVLTAQLGRMTLFEQGKYLTAAEGQRMRSLPVFAPRGIIYDRNMQPLVTNRAANSVFISYPFYNRPEVLLRLSEILNVPLAKIQQQVAEKKELREFFQPIRVKDDITPEQYAVIIERKSELPGVEIQPQPVRVYPHEDTAAHVLGYVGEINREELEQNPDYIPGDLIGQTGLEAFYERELRGKHGVRQVEIDMDNRPLGEVRSAEPQSGNSLVLTIDADLQRVAERALDWTMWRIRNLVHLDGPWPNAKAGAVVVMEVKTGAILAMASRPAFDPNLFATGISEEDYKKLQDPILTPEINRALHKAYQPGSTWKMMTSAAALDAGVIGPYDTVYCSGVYDKAGNPKDWTPYGHGHVHTVGALQGSCDIYYYEMGYRMGIDKLVDKAKEFGFGSRTRVDLGAENPGLLPDKETRTEIWERQLRDPWGVGHTVSASIGQIVQVTPLQLVRYAATLGNQGKVMKPYLVQKVIDAQGNTVKEFQPEQVGHVKIEPEHLKAILDGMAAVDTPPGGTSDYAVWPLPGIKTGGKTGTAENPPRDDYGLFVSLAPLNDPEIAIAVVIEQAAHGSSTSPVARTIQSAYFKVPLPAKDPARVPDEFPSNMAAVRRKFPVVGTGE